MNTVFFNTVIADMERECFNTAKTQGFRKEDAPDQPSYMSLPLVGKGQGPSRKKGFVPYITGWFEPPCVPLVPAEPHPIFVQAETSAFAIEMSPETDYIVKLVENVLTFVRLLSKAKDKEDYLLAVAVFAQCRSTTSLSKHITDRWDQLLGIQVQGDSPMDTFARLRDILDKYEMVKKLPFFTKLYKFIMYCIGLSVFEKMGISFDTKRFLQIEEAVIKKEYHMRPVS